MSEADAPLAPSTEAVETTAAPEDARSAADLLAEGLKLHSTRSYSEAAEAFSRAVEKLTEAHGELAPEVADALVLYGKALLRYAVSRSGVLGGTTKAAAAEAETAPVVAPVAGPSNAPPASRNFHFGGDDPEDDAEEEEDEAPVQEEDPEDDLETAFGVLDQAKVIYQKIEGREARLKLADTHDALGELLTESEKFEDSVVEFTASLEILRSLLAAHDRRIAEAHMMIALALEYVPTEPEKARQRAIYHAEQSKAVLQAKLEQLRASSAEDDKKETSNIEEVMTDLDLKIEDLKTSPIFDAQTEKDKALDAALDKPQLGATAPHNDLSGLVKKKKKPSTTETNGHAPPAALDGSTVNSGTLGEASTMSKENGKRKVEELLRDAGVEPALNGAAAAAPAGAHATVVVGGTAEAHEHMQKKARVDVASSP